MLYARGIEHHSNGVQNMLGLINLSAGDRPHRMAVSVASAPSSDKPTARAAASTGRSAISCRSGADIPESRTPPLYLWRVGHRRTRTARELGVDAYEMFRKIDTGEIKDSIAICFNPSVLVARQHLRHEVSREARVFRRHRFLLERHTAMPTSCCPARFHEEDEGLVTVVEGRIIKVSKAVAIPRRGAAGLAHHPGHCARVVAWIHVCRSALRSSMSCASRQAKADCRDFSGVTYEKSRARLRCVLALLRRRSADWRTARRSSRQSRCQPDRERRGTVLFSRRPRVSTSPTIAIPSTMRARTTRSSRPPAVSSASSRHQTPARAR